MEFRKVSLYDNWRQVARLLYHANVTAHNAWRGNEHEFVEFIEPWLGAKDFLYYYKNLRIATESQDRYPLAIVGGLEPTSATGAADFDYSVFQDKNSRFIVENFVADIIGWQKFLAKNEMQITVFGIDPALSDDSIGYDLLMDYIYTMKDRGYKAFRLSCNTNDYTAIQQYAKLGFRRLGESFNPADPTNTEARLANFAMRF